MSDIHFEVDMSLLGCNSKILWNDIYNQINDVVSTRANMHGIILCKYFHKIHSELLDIFYSYMQRLTAMSVKFIIITEQISFIPSNIINACAIMNINKPSKPQLLEFVKKKNSTLAVKHTVFTKRISAGQRISSEKIVDILENVDTNLILNLKEVQSFSLLKNSDELPSDVFNVVCDQIIRDMENIDEIPFTKFRDSLYDIMIYNLDVVECLWYIVAYFIQTGKFSSADTSNILQKIYPFLQYFNNNYRPIYHLENIMFYIINILNHETYNVNNRSATGSRNR